MKGTRRTFLMTTGGWLTGLAAGCGGGSSGGSSGGGGSTTDLLTRIEPTKAEQGMSFVGDSLSVRFAAAAQLFPEVERLATAGTSATGEVLASFAGMPSFASDSRLIALCAVLDRTQDRSAVRALTDFVERNLSGDLLYSLCTGVYVLRRLTDQPVTGGLAFYEGVTVQATVAAARAWLVANPGITQRHATLHRAQARFDGQSVRTRYLLRRDGVALGITFEVQRHATLEVPSTLAASITSDTVAKGGTLVSSYEGFPIDPLNGVASKYTNCAGFVLYQLFGIRGCYDTEALHQRLVAAGMVERGSAGEARKGDFVTFVDEAGKIPHVGVVGSTSPLAILNKDNQGPVFMAAPDAPYFSQRESGFFSAFRRPIWTPHYFYFPTSTGYIDAIMDPDPTLASNTAYLQDASGHVKGTIR